MNLDKVNEILFEQLERLARTDLTENELKVEIDRAKAMAITSSQIVASCTLKMRKDMFSTTKLLEG